VRPRGGMLNVHQIREAASDVSSGRMSVEDFERWLRKASRNVHAWGDAELVSAVLLVESVLSDFRFDGLEEDGVGKELAAALAPFGEPSPVLQFDLKPKIGWFACLPDGVLPKSAMRPASSRFEVQPLPSAQALPSRDCSSATLLDLTPVLV
jgi:hypothetical protein